MSEPQRHAWYLQAFSFQSNGHVPPPLHSWPAPHPEMPSRPLEPPEPLLLQLNSVQQSGNSASFCQCRGANTAASVSLLGLDGTLAPVLCVCADPAQAVCIGSRAHLGLHPQCRAGEEWGTKKVYTCASLLLQPNDAEEPVLVPLCFVGSI